MKLTLRNAARVIASLLLAVAAWRDLNYISSLEPANDSAIFMSVATHITGGRVLYKEIWENKPPMIFVLDAIALNSGDHTVNPVRTMERVFAVIAVAALVTAIFLAFGEFWIGVTAALLFLFNFYLPTVFEQGNITEEYGAIFTILGIAATIASLRAAGRRRLTFSGLAGLAFAFAILCKEPFFLIGLPWFVAVVWPRGGDWKSSVRCAGAFIGAALLPALIFLVYLVRHGALSSFIDMISFQFSYSKYAAPPPPPASFVVFLFRVAQERLFQFSAVCGVTALAGIGGLFSRSFVRATHGAPLVIAVSAAVSLLATSLGGRYYGHYFLEFVPSYTLLSATGIAFVTYLIRDQRRHIVGIVGAIILLIALARDLPQAMDFTARLRVPSARWKGLALSESVRLNTKPTDWVWAPWKPLIYSESNRLSPTRWHFALDYTFLDTRGSTRAQKFAMLRRDLEERPPSVIIVNNWGTMDVRPLIAKMGLTNWIAENYSQVNSPDGTAEILVYHR